MCVDWPAEGLRSMALMSSISSSTETPSPPNTSLGHTSLHGKKWCGFCGWISEHEYEYFTHEWSNLAYCSASSNHENNINLSQPRMFWPPENTRYTCISALYTVPLSPWRSDQRHCLRMFGIHQETLDMSHSIQSSVCGSVYVCVCVCVCVSVCACVCVRVLHC